MSTGATTSLEDVAAVGPKRWFQLYWFTDHGVTRELVERAAANGFGAIVVTVDAATEYWREGEERDPLRLPEGVSQQVLPGHPGLVYEPTLTWKSLEWLRSISPLPILLKGIIRAGDARLAADNGVAGVLVSNHGGREVDGCIPTLEALPAIVEAVDGRIEVLLDGGVRRGTDVLKALALGARAVLIGRAVQWGLGTGRRGRHRADAGADPRRAGLGDGPVRLPLRRRDHARHRPNEPGPAGRASAPSRPTLPPMTQAAERAESNVEGPASEFPSDHWSVLADRMVSRAAFRQLPPGTRLWWEFGPYRHKDG